MNRLLVIFFIFFSSSSIAQCPITGFVSPATACSTERIYLQNNAVGSTSYEWDFCSGDLGLIPSAQALTSNPSFFRARVFRTVSAGGKWYGFAIDQATNELIRFNFGSSLKNTPQVVSLGNPSSFQNPLDINFWQEGVNWFALVANTNGNSVLRLSFATDLESSPSFTDIGSLGGAFKSPSGVVIVKDGNSVIALVTNSSSAEIVRLNFGNSVSNNPTASIIGMAGSTPRGISIVRECDRWFSVITSYSTNELYYLDFKNGIGQPPLTGLLLIPSASYSFPATIRIKNEGGNFYGFVQSAFPGHVYRIDFGASIVDGLGTFSNLGNLGISSDNSAFDLGNEGSEWYAFSIDLSGNATPGAGRLMRLDFPNNCSANLSVYQGGMPPPISYQSGGNYRITQKVSSNEISNYLSRNISVSSNTAADIIFSSLNSCANNPINFTSQNTSGNLTTYAWNFGNTNTSSQPNPSNIYTTAGTYPVTLQVTATNGCTNTAKLDVAIYNQPIADFVLPSASPFCTNQNYVFINQSVFDAASNPTWEWRLNGTLVSSTQNLTQAFTSTTSQEIRLKAKIPGCENEIVKNINTLVPGPLVNFTSPTSGCQSTATAFTNTTTGSVTGYQWTFGDGNTSSSTNATNTYTNIGQYNVTLQANNAAGCQNTATKSITVYTKPQPDFSVGLPPFSCAGTASQFTDATPTPTDSNITGWQWAFGDAASGTSTLRNPTYTYPLAGTYNVSLSTSTNFGCTNSLTKSITISPSPIANFTNAVACINQPTQFNDASTGSIRSRLWTIQSNSFSTSSVQFSFTNAGSFPVSLTITGNNNCVSQFSKTINVPVQPSLDFLIQAPCTANPTVFTEITSGADVPVSQLWNFGGLGNSTGATAQFVFSAPNNYSVQLRSTRQSGCTYSITKNVSITQGPVADFTPSIDIGGPPLAVLFANTSTNANSYLWKFGDANNTTSTQTNPNFTFTDLGVYAVKLTAFNGLGCSFTTAKPITILVPSVNVVLSDFSLVPDQQTGVLQPMINILNRSNVPITNPDVLLDVESSGLIKKKVIGKIQPNQSLSVPVDLQIVPRRATYICAEVEVANNTADFDKRRCLPLSTTEVLFSPYPNPAQDNLNFDWISNEALPVNVVIFTSVGSVVFQQKFTSVATGLNRLELNTSTLPNGLYYINYSDSKTTKSFSFTIAK